MREALRALNRIVADQVIAAYAIGGANGAAFYIEAVPTEDIDVFVVLPPGESGLVTLTPIYDALTALGGVVEHQYVRFGAWPVQILTDANDLIAEAIREAREVEFDGVPTRVCRAEHLCAIALQAGRPKDYLRVAMFLQERQVDPRRLRELARRYGLLERLRRAGAGRS